MESLTQFHGAQLKWLQPRALARFYELRAGEVLLGTLGFTYVWRTMAIARTADGEWSFERAGIMHPRVNIRAAGYDEDVAVYQPRFWGEGMLKWPDGRSFTWRPKGFWALDGTLSDAAGQTVLRFSYNRERRKLGDMFKLQVVVELQQVEPYRDLLPLLLPLGLYLMLLRQQDAATMTSGSWS